MDQQNTLANATARIVVIDDGTPGWTRLSEKLVAAGIGDDEANHQELTINPFDIDSPAANS